MSSAKLAISTSFEKKYKTARKALAISTSFEKKYKTARKALAISTSFEKKYKTARKALAISTSFEKKYKTARKALNKSDLYVSLNAFKLKPSFKNAFLQPKCIQAKTFIQTEALQTNYHASFQFSFFCLFSIGQIIISLRAGTLKPYALSLVISETVKRFE